MPIPAPTLRVYVNPYFYIDHLGRPAGAVPVPHYMAAVREYVGAKLLVSKSADAPTFKIGDRNFETGPAVHDYTFKFEEGVVEILNIPEFRTAVRAGELVPADSDTAVICGLEKFEDAKKLLASLKESGIKEFDLRNGAGAFAYFEKQRGAGEKKQAATAVRGEV